MDMSPLQITQFVQAIHDELRMQDEARGLLPPRKERERFAGAWFELVEKAFKAGYEQCQTERKADQS